MFFVVLKVLILYRVGLSNCAPCGEIANSGPELIYTDRACQITQWPEMPDNITEVDVGWNYIETIEYTDTSRNITTINSEYNRLDVFPLLSGCASTLAVLYLRNNNISSIEPSRLDMLISLEFLSLKYNMLSTIPDVPGPSQTLTYLVLTSVFFSAK